ncbi:metal ABC transporter ATP-binding protein [Candidatus Saccharibacteria bacterium]|nr:metal ABC transporter ATP-binding protein [Candidatus Saccharibacteria bacterium]
MSIISLKKLTISYGKNTVIKNLSLDIEEKDFVCIVGPNGSGKSTLIRSILGLVAPKSGQIIFGDGLSRRFIGYMPQETTVDPNFPASVFEIVLSGTLNRPQTFFTKESKAVATNSLKLLSIENLKNKSFTELSGGQRQKVLLARSLSATKKLLVLDEPSNSLDQKSKNSFYKLLNKLNKEEGITIIMVTHDLDHGNLIGNKILSLRDEHVFFGSTEDFVKEIHHE